MYPDDVAWTKTQWTHFFGSLALLSGGSQANLLLFVNYFHLTLIREVVDKGNFWSTPQAYFWCKPDTSNPGGTRFISSVECLLFLYPKSNNIPFLSFSNEAQRRNFIVLPGILEAELVKSSDGEGLACQKPLALCRHLLDIFCPPGGNLLDLGSGTGSFVVAGLTHGCPYITAWEKAPLQQSLIEKRLTTIHAAEG